MHSKVAVPVICAVLGGAVTAGTLLAAGVVEPGSATTVVQSAVPLLASKPVGGTAVGDVYRRVAPGVVAVTARTVAVAASAFDDAAARRADGVVSGSGFVLDEDGHVVTVAHLVRAAADVRVEVAGRQVEARVVRLDEASDLAVLQLDADDLRLHPLVLGDSDTVQVGDPVVAMGSASGLAPTLAAGTVSARQARVTGPGGAAITGALQTDARVERGDCGGPLLDSSGRVIGVNTRMAIGDGGETVDLAVPADTARRVLTSLSGSGMKVVDG